MLIVLEEEELSERETVEYDMDADTGWEHPPQRPDRAKFESVFLYLISKYRNNPDVGRTSLHKLLYYIDFDHYEQHGRALMGLEYIHKQQGPFARQFEEWTADMAASGTIKIVDTGKEYEPIRYLPQGEPAVSLSQHEFDHVNRVLERLSPPHVANPLRVRRLSRLAHDEVPWLDTHIDETIPYHAVYHRTESTSVASQAD